MSSTIRCADLPDCLQDFMARPLTDPCPEECIIDPNGPEDVVTANDKLRKSLGKFSQALNKHAKRGSLPDTLSHRIAVATADAHLRHAKNAVETKDPKLVTEAAAGVDAATDLIAEPADQVNWRTVGAALSF